MEADGAAGSAPGSVRFVRSGLMHFQDIFLRFNLVSVPRPLTEEEIADLKERHYDSIAEKQRVVDLKLQTELALQEEKLRLEEEALYAAQREAARAAKQKKLLEQRRQQRITQRAAHAVNNGEFQSAVAEEDLDPFLRNAKFQYEAFRSSRLSSDATVLTPNTESSCDLMTKTKSVSGNDDSTSLDLEWEDEEGIYSAFQLLSELTNVGSLNCGDWK
ncbi:hypothetical protein WISP_63726 [Willisornis vidua]|uniref:AP1AR protein n=1 Tax=Willisornis vidua TaxID=1566151 RepID=A0ABQ9DCK1_9PASS|nr:hypothetical protein WISP_63726 [Willisornis vidua]